MTSPTAADKDNNAITDSVREDVSPDYDNVIMETAASVYARHDFTSRNDRGKQVTETTTGATTTTGVPAAAAESASDNFAPPTVETRRCQLKGGGVGESTDYNVSNRSIYNNSHKSPVTATTTAATATSTTDTHQRPISATVAKQEGLSPLTTLEGEFATVDKLHFASLDKLYGRHREIMQLNELFHDTCGCTTTTRKSKKKKQEQQKQNHHQQQLKKNQQQKQQKRKKIMVTIGGAPGTGKSELALETKKWVRRLGGFYISGKFDQKNDYTSQNNFNNNPYSAIVDACENLCEDLLFEKYREEGELSYNNWNFTFGDFVTKLREEFIVGENDPHETETAEPIHLLRSIIPSLDKILKSDDEHIGNDINPNDEQQQQQRGNHKHHPKSPNWEVNYFEVKQALQHAFVQFMKLVSTFGPIVLVIEDLQWVDDVTMELIEAIMLDNNSEENKNSSSSIMIVGTYRDTEVDQDHVFCQAVDRLNNNNNHSSTEKKVSLGARLVVDMKAGNLTPVDIYSMLQDLLAIPSSEDDDATRRSLAHFADCVFRKTNGNALYVKQFLLSLERQGYLKYDFGLVRWNWDLETINTRAMATENVVQLLTEKLNNLPEQLRRLLPRAACIGSTFSSSTFQIIVDHYCDQQDVQELLDQYKKEPTGTSAGGQSRLQTRNQPSAGDIGDAASDPNTVKNQRWVSLLDICQHEGLITIGRADYRWEHDKIQEAALALVSSDEELRSIKFDVGDVLFKKFTSDQLSRELFVVTNLLNTGIDRLKRENWFNSRRSEIAKLNLSSGMAAMASSAFASASDYLTNAIKLLPDNKWNFDTRDLALEIYSNAAEASFCVGTHAYTHKLCDEVLLLEDFNVLEKRRIYNVLILTVGAEDHATKARDITMETLAKLGCKFPKRSMSLHALVGFMHTAATVEKTTAKLATMGTSTDPKEQWIMYLLDRLATITYQCDPDLLPLAFLKGLRVTKQYGIGVYSAPCLATIGLIVAASIGDLAVGKKFADLAIRFMNQRTKSRTLFLVYEFVLHYQIQYENCKKPLFEAYEAGLKSGDLESAFWSLYAFLEIHLFTGGKLSKLLKHMEEYTAQVEHFKQDKILSSMRMLYQVLTNLVCPSSKQHILQGDVMDEVEWANDIEGKPEHAHTYQQLNRYKTMVAFWFNKHGLVVNLIEKMGYHKFLVEKITPGFLGIGPLYFYCALSCLSMARNEPKVSKHKKRAKKFLSKFKGWTTKGHPNVSHFQELISAELASLRGDVHTAKIHYEVAIYLAGRWGRIGDQGLAHERFGDHCMTVGEERTAAYNYTHAIKLYEEWGAMAKCDILRSSAQALVMPVAEVKITDSPMLDFSNMLEGASTVMDTHESEDDTTLF